MFKKIAAKFISQYFESNKGLLLKFAQMYGTSKNVLDEFKDLSTSIENHQITFDEILEFYPELQKIEGQFTIHESFIASLSVVFKLTDHNKKNWALKVKLPEIDKTIKKQLNVLGLSKNILKLKKELIEFNIDQYISEIEYMIEKELDFEQERKNIYLFSKYNSNKVFIPQLHEIQGKNFILMSFFEGKNIKETNISKDLANVYFKTYLDQLINLGVIQGDTNFGNYLFSEEQMAMIDFGSIIRLTPLERKVFLELLQNKDYKNGCDYLIALGFDKNKIAIISNKIPILLQLILSPFVSTNYDGLKNWHLKKNLKLLLGNDNWVFRSAGSSRFFLFIRSFSGFVNSLVLMKQDIYFKDIIESILVPDELIDVEIPKHNVPTIPINLEKRQLRITIKSNGKTKVDLSLPGKSLFIIEDLISSKTLNLIKKSGINIDKIKRVGFDNFLQPQTLLDIEIEENHYKIEIF